jgi:hypothetical protein
VEGHHDRLGYNALAERAQALGRLKSFASAAINMVEAQGDGDAAKLARAAKSLGIHAVVLLDNDAGAPAVGDPIVTAALAEADAVVRLPPRMAVEDILMDGVADAELIRVFRELETAFNDLALPPAWDGLTGRRLRQTLKTTLHDRPGSLHPSYIWELAEAELPSRAIAALEVIRDVAVVRRTGLIEL